MGSALPQGMEFYQAATCARTLYFRCRTQEAIGEILNQPYQDFIELPPQQDSYTPSLLPELPELPEAPLRLWLSNHTCYRWLIGKQISTFLAHRFSLTPHCENNIGLALHEAISNALIHGHLEIASPYNSLLDFQDYYQLIEDRLAEPGSYQQRLGIAIAWVNNSITLTVANEGPGYNFNAYLPEKKPGTTPSTRGLDLIAQLSQDLQISDEGRNLSMSFAIETRQRP